MKKLPILRHIRFFYWNFIVHLVAFQWYLHGIGMGVPNHSDLEYLNKIWNDHE